MSASKGTAINLPDYLRFGWLLFLALRVHSFSRFKDLVTCTNGLVSILVVREQFLIVKFCPTLLSFGGLLDADGLTYFEDLMEESSLPLSLAILDIYLEQETATSPLSPSRSPASAANGSLPGVKMPPTPVTTAMTTAKWLRTVISPLPSKPSAELERFLSFCDKDITELVLATHKTVTMLFPVVLERTGITAFDLSKVIESFIRHEESLPRELRRHLNSLEERLLESMVWGKGSSLYNSLIVARPALSFEINRLGLLAEPMMTLDSIAMHHNITFGNLPPLPPMHKHETPQAQHNQILQQGGKRVLRQGSIFSSVSEQLFSSIGILTRSSFAEHVDIITFYNAVFIPTVKPLLVNLGTGGASPKTNRLPESSNHPDGPCPGSPRVASFPSIPDMSPKKVSAGFEWDDNVNVIDVRLICAETNEIARYLLVGGAAASGTMREGWGEWFDKKGDFLRRDRMFRSNLELLNPMNNMLLQDPDSVGLTVLTRGDKLMQKAMLNEFRKLPFSVKNRFGAADGGNGGDGSTQGRTNEVKGSVRRTLDDNGGDGKESKDVVSGFDSSNFSRIERNVENGGFDSSNFSRIERNVENGGFDNGSMKEVEKLSYERRRAAELRANNVMDAEKVDKLLPNGFGRHSRVRGKVEEVRLETSGPVYADGKRWGYFPGLLPHLPFSRFMEEFFRLGKCEMKVFMVWNSPPWMFGVRHQRGLESLLYHHPDACVVVFSETLELDFFKDFVKDGYKVSVAMPNLDELLKNTPTHAFASLWFEWRKTKFYPTHYSELIRLAVLHMYGGMYLDFDVIVMKPLLSLHNSVGLENLYDNSSLNGAVMTFGKNSPFILECLKEFYATYDDTQLRWNGADLLTRVVDKFLNGEKNSENQIGIKMQPSSMFFPIDRRSITRYFAAPTDDTERDLQENLFRKILDESFTFHFWNSITSTLVPEPGSLVARLLNQHCMRCLDTL
ncbi:hypothetical protein Syun_010758 [Stephania yunnanensis]|uniref:Retinoblastoma-associated protein A-box domain-containing protein n=1 Tax=Stephania yunnanensis TaxID=152371 RepID=A0AAP0KIV6_9MAGN